MNWTKTTVDIPGSFNCRRLHAVITQLFHAGLNTHGTEPQFFAQRNRNWNLFRIHNKSVWLFIPFYVGQKIKKEMTSFWERETMLFPTLNRLDFVHFVAAKYGLDRPDMKCSGSSTLRLWNRNRNFSDVVSRTRTAISRYCSTTLLSVQKQEPHCWNRETKVRYWWINRV
jgi:hypothetical protein